MSDPNEDDDLRYLRHVLERTGKKAGGLAAMVGIAGSTLTRRLNSDDYKFVLSTPTLKKIEEGTGISYAQFIASSSAPEQDRSKGQPINLVAGEDVVIPGRGKLLPVFSGAVGGPGKLIVSSDFVDHMPMPAALAGVTGAYGLIIDGSSMNPEYWEGDVAWVNPHLKPARGRNHIFFHTPPGGEDAEAIIKRLNGWNDREWDLEQWNPHTQFKESRKIWPICHRVVGKYDAP
jgi:phage repressor protein C with HTH and peptisase S24 domain